MLSRFVIAFLPRSKYLNFVTTVTVHRDLGAQENKICHYFHFSLSFAMKWWDWMPWSSFFECWVLSLLFHSPLPPSSTGSLVPLYFLPLKWYHLYIWGCWYLFTEHSPAHHSKTQFFPQPVSPIRKLAQASYPHPTDGRQKKQELQYHSL